MTDKRISELDLASTLDGSEVIPLVQSGRTRQAQLQTLLDPTLMRDQLSATGSVARTQHEKNGETVTVADFGAVGDGVTNDTAAIQAAITAAGVGGKLLFKGNSNIYLITTGLVQLTNQKWVGEGGYRAATLKKGANIDMVTMGDLGAIADLNFDGNGGTYTGRGIYCSAGFSFKIDNVRVNDTASACLEFAANVGGGTNVNGFEGVTHSPSTVPAIKFGADNTAVPRFFNGIWLAGGDIDMSLMNGGGVDITSFYIRNLIFGSATSLVNFANGRLATGVGPVTTTISGTDCTFSGISFAGPVALSGAQGMLFGPCNFSSITEDPATCQYNAFTQQATSYTPAWTQGSGTQPSLGNGTLTGYYTRNGTLVTVSIELVIGSTTTTGNSATGYRFSIPFPGHQSRTQRAFYMDVTDVSVPTKYVAQGVIGANEAYIQPGTASQAVRDGFPFTWATGDTIQTTFSYICR